MNRTDVKQWQLVLFLLLTTACANDHRPAVAWQGSETMLLVTMHSDTSLNSPLVRELRGRLSAGIEVPGIPLPQSWVSKKPALTFVLVDDDTGQSRGVVATAFPRTSEVLLRHDGFSRLTSSERSQVIVHEAAHVALAAFYAHAPLPEWLSEGVAEWAASDLDCGWSARVWLETIVRVRTGESLPSVRRYSMRDGRLGRDYLTSFFRYLEAVDASALREGSLFEDLRTHGIDAGFERAFGASIDKLEDGWREALTRTMDQPLPDTCSANTW